MKVRSSEDPLGGGVEDPVSWWSLISLKISCALLADTGLLRVLLQPTGWGRASSLQHIWKMGVLNDLETPFQQTHQLYQTSLNLLRQLFHHR